MARFVNPARGIVGDEKRRVGVFEDPGTGPFLTGIELPAVIDRYGFGNGVHPSRSWLLGGSGGFDRLPA
jgi:hypothetical protein